MNPFLRVLLRLVFPSLCPLCSLDRPVDFREPVCPDCLRLFPVNPLCEPGGRPVRLIYSAMEYEGAARELLLRLKYGGRDDFADLLGRLSLQALNLDAKNFDCVVPVPVSLWTGWRRGYNQAHLLAAGIAAGLKRPLITGWLASRIFIPSQTRLDRPGRRKNARRRFYSTRKKRFPFARVLLVDDVKTTGATLEQCGALLRKAGAKRVSALVVARDVIAF